MTLKRVTWCYLGEKTEEIGENSTQSKMVADDAWEKAEEIEVCVVCDAQAISNQDTTKH